MTAWEQIDVPKPVERDHHGRPKIIPPGKDKAVAYSRCTKFIDAVEDTYNLSKWTQRNVAIGLLDRPDLLMAVAGARDDKRALDQVCRDAAEAAKASAKATIGTSLHSLTERIDKGEEVGSVPAEYLADLAAYQAVTAELKMLHIEPLCVLDAWKIAGTPDRVVKYKGKIRIFDLKTGSLDWGMGKIASQLAVYSRSMLYDHVTNTRTAHNAEIDWGIVAHLPAGSGQCTLYRVNLEQGWRGVQLSKWVRDWRGKKFEHLSSPLDEDLPAERLIDKIKQAKTVEDLYALHREHREEWSKKHTTAAKARKDQLTEEGRTQ